MMDSKQKLDREIERPRRAFLRRAGMLLGSLAFWGAVEPLVRENTDIDPTLHVAAAQYLKPSYIPAGYRYVTTYTDRPDGFRGGASEIALWYVKPNDPLAIGRPLSIYQAEQPQLDRLITTEKRQPSIVSVNLHSGNKVQARYFDGLWVAPQTTNARPQWGNHDAHSLVMTVNNLSVGLRGSRVAGVSYDDLIRVAASLG